MAAGLPVIGSRVSGTEDFVVLGTTGWLFEPGSTAELARCLVEAGAVDGAVLNEMGQRAQRRIAETASLEAVTSALISHYAFDGNTNTNNAEKSAKIT